MRAIGISCLEHEESAPEPVTGATPDFEMNEDGLMVATRAFLLRRGYCCGNGCLNCPYRGTAEDRGPLWMRDIREEAGG